MARLAAHRGVTHSNHEPLPAAAFRKGSPGAGILVVAAPVGKLVRLQLGMANVADGDRFPPKGMCDVIADMADLAKDAFMGFGVQCRVVIRLMRLAEE